MNIVILQAIAGRSTTKTVETLTTRWGRFVDVLIEPAVLRLSPQKSIDVKEVSSQN
ncbi:hypothetical protein VB774_19835 [Pseudanabaena galeata UHCC 0370]|uniref:Uncharacterized protein n=1 Tax=Pseudanabaena galeata UHCC 0370 TaxID=3110310 RepID=A0ABU5TPI2_9CYAN|nr:hypothetical protein [Pseudanabaena galeata]MEA5479883.1 hypothetical protein [Pseudanabaena galeata UHCC 0370]